MARSRKPDPKAAALAAARSLNPHPEAVVDEAFATSPFLDPRDLVLEWTAPEAEQVEIIIEQDELEDVFDVTFSGSPPRMRVPRQFLQPGMEYKIEILSIAENGNRVITEGTFETAPE